MADAAPNYVDAVELRIVRMVLEDCRAGVTTGGCTCNIASCPGPGAHWVPRDIIPKSLKGAKHNEIRRTDNRARLITLAYTVAVLRRNGDEADALELEQWTRERWHCGDLPREDDRQVRDEWVTAHLRRINPPEKA